MGQTWQMLNLRARESFIHGRREAESDPYKSLCIDMASWMRDASEHIDLDLATYIAREYQRLMARLNELSSTGTST
jgi:hypothetical protein